MRDSGYNRSAEVVFAQRSDQRECLDKCLRRLKPQECAVILDIFSDKKIDLIDFEADLKARGVSIMRLKTIRHRLKTCIEKCLREIEG